MFQFPTGWNSTTCFLRVCIFGQVSIPNGMEFYFADGKFNGTIDRFQFPTGWNSTVPTAWIE